MVRTHVQGAAIILPILATKIVSTTSSWDLSQTIAMEACANAHYWGRHFLADGHQVLLNNPRFVKPFVKEFWRLGFAWAS
jgi:transposase